MLTAALLHFGELPNAAQEQLIGCLVLSFGHYQRLARSERVTLSEQRKRLQGVEKSAKKLLLQFGIKPSCVAPRQLWENSSHRPSSERLRSLGQQNPDGRGVMMSLVTANISTSGKDTSAVNAELSAAADRVADAVIALLDLYEHANAAAQQATRRIAPGRGGARHRPHAKGRLISDAIRIYDHMRKRHPVSGNKAALGGPMVKFVQAVAALYGAQVSEVDIGAVWRTRKSNDK